MYNLLVARPVQVFSKVVGRVVTSRSAPSGQGSPGSRILLPSTTEPTTEEPGDWGWNPIACALWLDRGGDVCVRITRSGVLP